LLRRLSGEGTILCVALSSNVATGAVPGFQTHPLRLLVDAGVRVALSADDPLLFDCSTAGEFRLAREHLGLTEAELLALAENSWHAAFCDERRKREGLVALKSASFAPGTA
jgi:adenosine deaminase